MYLVIGTVRSSGWIPQQHNNF